MKSFNTDFLRPILLVTGLILLVFTSSAFAEIEINKIRFENNQFASKSDLEDIIHSEEGNNYEPRLIKLDKILLNNYYRQNGYLNVDIRDSVLVISKREKVDIIYYINEGQRFYYGGIRMKGNQEIESKAISDQFKGIDLYSPLDEVKVNESVKNVENIYYNSGKPFIQLDVNYLIESDSLIVLLLNITENQTVYIAKVEYYGLNVVKKFLLRRELELKEGDKYSRKAIDKSQENLYGTGLLKYARLEIETIKDHPDQVILKVLIQEKEPRWIGFRLGMAYEEQTSYGNKLEFTAQAGHRNLFGTARSVSLSVTPSITYDIEKNKFYDTEYKVYFNFVEPWIGNTRTPGILSASYEQYRPLNSGHFDLFSASFNVKKKWNDYTQLSGALSVDLVNLINDVTIDPEIAATIDINKSKVYSLTFYGKRDNRKNLFTPTRSSYTDLSAGFSYSTGKDNENKTINNSYFTIISSWQRYQPFRPKVFSLKRFNWTLASRLKIGAILEPGKKQAIPINDRFFAGGASSVRGYQEQLLGPALLTDSKGKIVKAAGGKLLYLGNLEVRIPLVWVLMLETFLDSGYVWPEVSSFSPADIKLTTGLGMAVITPLGPVRVDYGYKLIPSDTDPSPDAFHLGIYLAF